MSLIYKVLSAFLTLKDSFNVLISLPFIDMNNILDFYVVYEHVYFHTFSLLYIVYYVCLSLLSPLSLISSSFPLISFVFPSTSLHCYRKPPLDCLFQSISKIGIGNFFYPFYSSPSCLMLIFFCYQQYI